MFRKLVSETYRYYTESVEVLPDYISKSSSNPNQYGELISECLKIYTNMASIYGDQPLKFLLPSARKSQGIFIEIVNQFNNFVKIQNNITKMCNAGKYRNDLKTVQYVSVSNPKSIIQRNDIAKCSRKQMVSESLEVIVIT